MVTGWACEFASEDSRRRAVEGVLGKPLDLGELRTVLGRIASTHRGAFDRLRRAQARLSSPSGAKGSSTMKEQPRPG